MDPLTQQLILAAVGGAVILAVVAWVYSSIKGARIAARRRYNGGPRIVQTESRREPQSTCSCGRDPNDCNCPPHEGRKCVPARVRVPDPTPVAIYGVSDDECCNDGRITRSQLQLIADRANELKRIREGEEIDALLASLGSRGTASKKGA
jgi:hypothetical protein